MDPDIARLASIPGDYDLSVDEAAEVLQLNRKTVERAMKHGLLASKRHQGRGRGCSSRIRIPRAALVAYICKSYHGDKSVLLAAVAAQLPQYLPIAQGLPPAALPAPTANSKPKPRAKRQPDPYAGHPDLFAEPVTTTTTA